MGVCDWCGKSLRGGSTIIPASQIKSAVRAGMGPPKMMYQTVGDMDVPIARDSFLQLMGVGSGDMKTAEKAWERQVMTDNTNWAVCADCDKLIRPHLTKPQPWWKLW